MNRTVVAAALLISLASLSAKAEQPTYDYATKFYPHPAMLFLHAEAPRQMSEHPAVIVARKAKAGEAESVAAASEKFYLHPASMFLAATAPSESPVPQAAVTMLAAAH